MPIWSKRLGSTHFQIPEIGFGTWNYGAGAKPLCAAIDQGASFIDTAELYGTEEVVGQAIQGQRHDVFLATKARPLNFRRQALIAAAENSLRRLGTDFIDLYQLHWPNYTVPIEETMGVLEELADAGKIRFIGVSNFSLEDLRKAQAALRKHKIVSVQMKYSLIERTVEHDLIGFCEENQITMLAYSPLGTNFSEFKRSDRRGVLSSIAQRTGRTEAQIALNWLIAKPSVVALVKASTTAHVLEDCGASGWRLNQDDYALLENCIGYRRLHRSWLRSALSRSKNYAYQLAGREL